MTAEETTELLERALARRDEQWHQFHEKLTVEFHKELHRIERKLRKQIDRVNASVGSIVADRREFNTRLSKVEERALRVVG